MLIPCLTLIWVVGALGMFVVVFFFLLSCVLGSEARSRTEVDDVSLRDAISEVLSQGKV